MESGPKGGPFLAHTLDRVAARGARRPCSLESNGTNPPDAFETRVTSPNERMQNQVMPRAHSYTCHADVKCPRKEILASRRELRGWGKEARVSHLSLSICICLKALLIRILEEGALTKEALRRALKAFKLGVSRAWPLEPLAMRERTRFSVQPVLLPREIQFTCLRHTSASDRPLGCSLLTSTS
jgi:hypothetical protein